MNSGASPAWTKTSSPSRASRRVTPGCGRSTSEYPWPPPLARRDWACSLITSRTIRRPPPDTASCSTCSNRVAQALLAGASRLMGTLLVRLPRHTREKCRDESRHGRHECLRHVGCQRPPSAGRRALGGAGALEGVHVAIGFVERGA